MAEYESTSSLGEVNLKLSMRQNCFMSVTSTLCTMRYQNDAGRHPPYSQLYATIYNSLTPN